jgi:hypothetical protein
LIFAAGPRALGAFLGRCSHFILVFTPEASHRSRQSSSGTSRLRIEFVDHPTS